MQILERKNGRKIDFYKKRNPGIAEYRYPEGSHAVREVGYHPTQQT